MTEEFSEKDKSEKDKSEKEKIAIPTVRLTQNFFTEIKNLTSAQEKCFAELDQIECIFQNSYSINHQQLISIIWDIFPVEIRKTIDNIIKSPVYPVSFVQFDIPEYKISTFVRKYHKNVAKRKTLNTMLDGFDPEISQFIRNNKYQKLIEKEISLLVFAIFDDNIKFVE